MKIKLGTLMIYGLAALAGTALMSTSQHVQNAERELNQLQIARDDATDNLHLLNAEWTYLTRPERLEQLAAQNLTTLTPVQPAQLRDDFDFQMPVIEEMPTGPTMMPQEAVAKAAVTPAVAPAPVTVTEEPSQTSLEAAPTDALPAEDQAYSPSYPPAQKPTVPVQRPVAIGVPADAPSSQTAEFSRLLNRVSEPAAGGAIQR
jgi:hypothetical protein